KTEHTMEWAVRAGTQLKNGPSGAVVNQTLRLLCRRGALDATAVRPYRGFKDLAPLKELARGISVKEGERYADYREGEKLFAAHGADLFSGQVFSTKTVETASASLNGIKGFTAVWIFWGGIGILTLGLASAGMMGFKRLRRRPERSQQTPALEPQAEKKAEQVLANISSPSGNGTRSAGSEAKAPAFSAPVASKPAPVLAIKRTPIPAR